MASIGSKLSRSALLLVGVAVLMVLVYGGAYLVGAGLEPPRIAMPPYDVTEFPWEIQLPSGQWHGRPSQIDERLTRALRSQATVVENREYRGPAGQVITMHVAIFNDHQLGLTHTPFLCYRGNGWEKLDSEYVAVRGAAGQEAEISVSMWRLEERRAYVVYWYQFGDEVLLDRHDLGKFRWKMAGKDSWPALVKVLLETRAEGGQDRQSIVELADYIYRWLTAGGQPLEATEGDQAQPLAAPDITAARKRAAELDPGDERSLDGA